MVAADENVYHVGPGGSVLKHVGGSITIHPRLDPDDAGWRLDDTWLLLDGWAAMVPYAEKSSKAVVFASPKKKNYHELIKSGGLRFFMPPWSLDEVTPLCLKLNDSEREEILKPWLPADFEVDIDPAHIPSHHSGISFLIHVTLFFNR